MEELIQIKDFFVTTKSLDSIFWRILPSIREMIRLLNEELQIRNYGKEIEFLMFVFVILPEENQRHQNYLRYSKNDLILQYCIPYEALAISLPRENLSFLAHYFLEALSFYQDAQLEDFRSLNFTQLRADVSCLFQTQEWLFPLM